MNKRNDDKQYDLHVPEELRDDLRESFADAPDVPKEVTQDLMDRARGELQQRPRILTLPRVAAAAAAVAVVICVFLFSPENTQRKAKMAASDASGAVAEDIDGNGRVNVLDAMRFARRLERSEASDGGPDLNEDGRVDRGDVDAVAMAAVSLNGRNKR